MACDCCIKSHNRRFHLIDYVRPWSVFHSPSDGFGVLLERCRNTNCHHIFEMALSVSVNFISSVNFCAGLQEEEPQKAVSMSFTWVSHIATSVLPLPNQLSSLSTSVSPFLSSPPLGTVNFMYRKNPAASICIKSVLSQFSQLLVFGCANN